MQFSFKKFLRPYNVSVASEMSELRSFFAGTPQGFFVDVGAHAKGIFTIELEERGWSGLLIEPQPELADRLRNSRKAPVVECLVGSPSEHGSNQIFFRNIRSGLSTLHPEDQTQHDWIETITRSTRTLDSILEEYNVPLNFDLLKVDVEFHELPVMQGFNFAHWSPRLIVIEDHAYDHKLHNYITAHGYKYYRRVGLNTWYVPKTAPYPVTVPMRFAFIRKYYLGLLPRVVKRSASKLIRKFR